MQTRTKIITVGLLLTSTVALAALEPWTDYEPSESVWLVTTIRVEPNMDDEYLEGIARTWVTTNEAAKRVGQIADYEIWRSDLPQSGDFNLMLMIRFAKTDDLAPTKARYDAFIKEFGKANADATTEYSQKNYPAMRTQTGQYLFRKITLKKTKTK